MAELIGKNMNSKYQEGFSTLEILIAFAVLITTIVAVTLVVFGNQSISSDSQTNDEALYLAQQQLEDARSLRGYASYDSIITSVPASVSFPYTKQLIVPDPPISDCIKQIISQIRWSNRTRSLKVQLSTLLSNPQKSQDISSDCNTIAHSSDDFRKPKSLNHSNLNIDGHTSGIDVQSKIAFITTTTAGNNKDDFYIVDVTDFQNPAKRGHADLSDNLQDIDVAGNFAYIANDETEGSGQLQVVDVNSLDLPNPVASVSLPGVSGSCPYTCPGGRSIFYFKGKVFIGTHRLVGAAKHEFHVYDVATSPCSPSAPCWLGSLKIDHNVNDIVVRNQIISGANKTIAYLATSSDAGEIIILDVTNCDQSVCTISQLSSFNAKNSDDTDSDKNGTTLYVIGNKLFLGRERATGPKERDLFILDITNPALLSAASSQNCDTAPSLPVLGCRKLNLNSSSSHDILVSGIRVTGNLVFLGTSDPNNPFEAWDISSLPSLVRQELPGCAINFSTYVTSLDYENNLIYVGVDGGDNVIIIKPTGGISGACS